MNKEIKEKNYKDILNKEGIQLAEFYDNKLCWFKCKITSKINTIVENIKNIENQKKLNPLLIDLIVKNNIFYNHIKSPAPLLGIAEQDLVYIYEVKEKNNNKYIKIKSIDKKSIFEDTNRNNIEYFKIEENNNDIEVYAVIEPSQKILGNKHVNYLRNFLFYFLKSIK